MRPLCLLAALIGLTSCYRDDVHTLYSEQFVNDGNRELRLLPLQAMYSDPGSLYDAQTNELVVLPETSIELPYIKRGDLPELLASLPGSWSHRIDQEKKIIYLQAPSLSAFIEESPLNGRDLTSDVLINGSALFTSRTLKGHTFSQEIKVRIPTDIYMHTPLYEPADQMLSAAGSGRDFAASDLTAKRYTRHLHMYTGYVHEPQDLEQTLSAEQTLAVLKQKIQWRVKRFAQERRYDQISYRDYLYDADSLSIYKRSKGQDVLLMLGVKADAQGKPAYLSGPKLGLKQPRYVPTIPWNSYYNPKRVTIMHDGPIGVYSELSRAGIGTQLELKNPKKYFGLGASETFDPSRLTVYTGSRLFVDEQREDAPEEYEAPIVAVAKNCASYDATKDMLSASFVTLPPLSGASNASLVLAYQRANGTIVYRLMTHADADGYNDLLLADTGTWRHFWLDANEDMLHGHTDMLVNNEATGGYVRKVRVAIVSEALDPSRTIFTAPEY